MDIPAWLPLAVAACIVLMLTRGASLLVQILAIAAAITILLGLP